MTPLGGMNGGPVADPSRCVSRSVACKNIPRDTQRDGSATGPPFIKGQQRTSSRWTFFNGMKKEDRLKTVLLNEERITRTRRWT